MNCEVCGLRSATHIFVEVTREHRLERRVCETCAWKLALALPEGASVKPVAPKRPMLPPGKEEMERVCSRCGRPYTEVKKTLLVGCAECYAAFLENLKAFLKKLHDTEVVYKGRAYAHDPRRRTLMEERQELLSRLEELVSEERFEEAARVRDRLRVIEEELGWTSSKN